MKYSKEWTNKIQSMSSFVPDYSWDNLITHYRFNDKEVAETYKLVILNEGVWMEISDLYFDTYYFEKVRAITKEDVYFDGSSTDCCYALGSLDHIFRIDGHVLDIRRLPRYSEKTKQELLLEFINTYAGVLDSRLPPVPKGILKL